MSARFIQAIENNGKNTFSLAEAADFYHGKQEIYKFINDLVKRGLLVSIKPGTYMLLHAGQENIQLSNWPIIANILTGAEPHAITHYSAMRLHGMTNHPLNTIYISTSKRRRNATIHHTHYQFIYTSPENLWGHQIKWVTQQDKVIVSDLEKTILDALLRPELCGGIKEVVRGIWIKQHQIDWGNLKKHIRKFSKKSAVKRLGFILELLEINHDMLGILHEEVKHQKDYIFLDPKREHSGKRMGKWHIRINLNVEELKASIWG